MKITTIESFIIVKMILNIAFIVGWCINIFQIIDDFTAWGDVGVEMVLRIVGILAAPLGAFMGLFIW